MDDVHVQCLKCAKVYVLEDKLKDQAIDLYAEVKARGELIAEGKIKG
jgi:hypothetical protein